MNDCNRVLDALAEGAALDGPLRAHVALCADCGALVAADRHLTTARVTDAGDEELPPALRAALAADAGPVTAFDARRRALPALAAAALVAVAAVVVMPRADLAHQPMARVAVGLVAATSGVLGSLALLLHGGSRGLGVSARARWVFVAAALAAFAAVTALVTVPVEGSVELTGAAAWQARVGCALHGTLFAAVVGTLVFYGARRSAAVSPTAAGAVAGLAAGFVGALAQHLHCPVMDLDHTLVAHVAPLVVGAAAGALAGRRWLAP